MDFHTLARHLRESAAMIPDRHLLAQVIGLAPDGIGLLLKTDGGWLCWHLFVRPDHQGFLLSPQWEEAPGEQPFVRLLHRHLADAHLERVGLYEHEGKPVPDRVAEWRWAVRDRFFGGHRDFSLVLELTGRVVNLLLLDEDRVVIDQLVPTANNRPKAVYTPPDRSGDPLDPLTATPAQLAAVLASPPSTWRDRLLGWSPLLAKEWQARVAAAVETAAGEIADRAALLLEVVREASGEGPLSCRHDGRRILALSSLRLTPVAGSAETMTFDTVNEALIWSEEHLCRARRLGELKTRAVAAFQKDLDQKCAIIADQDRLIAEYRGCDHLQRKGEILLCHLHEIPPRTTVVRFPDWDTGQDVEIPLDPRFPPARNAERYFHRCKKARRGLVEAEKRRQEIVGEVAWLREQIWLAEQATQPADLLQLPSLGGRRRRSPHLDPLPASGERKKSRQDRTVKPLVEIDGCKFFVGRNGRQNDVVTFQVGRKGDIWFHANDVPGAHVVARRPDGGPTEEDRLRGAALAAWFIFARDGSKVPVDATDVAHVRRIPGGVPGRVSYTHQTTYRVDPRSALSWVTL